MKNIIRMVGLSPKGQLYHKDNRDLDNQGWKWRPHREADIYAAVSRLAHLVPGSRGFRHIGKPHGEFRDQGAAELEMGLLECSCDIDSSVIELLHEPREKRGWPTGGYWPIGGFCSWFRVWGDAGVPVPWTGSRRTPGGTGPLVSFGGRPMRRGDRPFDPKGVSRLVRLPAVFSST